MNNASRTTGNPPNETHSTSKAVLWTIAIIIAAVVAGYFVFATYENNRVQTQPGAYGTNDATQRNGAMNRSPAAGPATRTGNDTMDATPDTDAPTETAPIQRDSGTYGGEDIPSPTTAPAEDIAPDNTNSDFGTGTETLGSEPEVPAPNNIPNP